MSEVAILDRRSAFVVATAAAASLATRAGPATAQTPQALAPVNDFSRTLPAQEPDISHLVTGQYELVYQENIAQGMQLVGFSQDYVVSLLVDERHRFGYRVDNMSLFLLDAMGGQQMVPLGQRQQDTVSGARIDDLLSYFDRSDRLITTFVSPNKKKVWSVRLFLGSGILQSMTVDGEERFLATRVWRRVPAQAGRSGISLL